MPDNTIEVLLQAKFGEFSDALEDAKDQLADAIGEMSDNVQSLNDAFDGLAEHMGDSAKEGGEAFKDAMSEALDGIKEKVVSLAEAFGVFEAGHKLEEWIKQSLELGEKMDTLSIQTRISTDHLQVLDFAAQAAGSSIDRLALMVTRLSRASEDTAPQLKGALAFFHLSKADLGDAYTALEKIGDVMEKAGPKAATAATAYSELFGRMGLALLPAIERIKEFEKRLREMGLMLSTEQLSALEKTKEAWNILGFVWQQDKAALTAALTPALLAAANILNTLFTGLGRNINSSKQLEAEAQKLGFRMLELTRTIGNETIPTLERLSSAWTAVSDAMEFVEHPLATIETRIKTSELDQYTDHLRLLTDREKEIAEAGKKAEPGLRPAYAAQLKAIQTQIEQYQKGIGDLDKAIEAYGTAKTTGDPRLAAFNKQIDDAEANLKNLDKGLPEMFGATGAPGPLPEVATPQELVKRIAEMAKVKEEQLGIADETNKQLVAMGKETQAQLLVQEQDLANQKYAIQLTALQQEMRVAGLKQTERDSLRAQELELEASHAKDIIAMQTRAGTEARAEKAKDLEAGQTLLDKEFEYRKRIIADAAKLVRDSGAQEAQLTQQVVDQEFRAREDNIKQLIALDYTTADEKKKLYEQLKQLDLDWRNASLDNAEKVAEAHKKAAEEAEAAWDKDFESLNNSIDQVFDAFTSHSKNMREEFRKMIQGMEKDLVTSTIKDALIGGEKGSIGAAIFGEKGFGGGLAGKVAGWFGGKSPGDVVKVHVVNFPGGGAAGVPGKGNIAGPPSPAAGSVAGGWEDKYAKGVQGLSDSMAGLLNGLGLHRAAMVVATATQLLMLPVWVANTASTVANTVATLVQAASGFLHFDSGGMVPGSGPQMAVVHGGEFVLNRSTVNALSTGQIAMLHPDYLGSGPRVNGAIFNNSTTNNQFHMPATFHVSSAGDPHAFANEVMNTMKDRMRNSDPRITSMSRAGLRTGFPR